MGKWSGALIAGAAAGAVAVSGAGVLAVVAVRAIKDAITSVNLSGKVVLIIGGSRGLGLALAEECARHGCKLAICGRNEEALRRAESELLGKAAEVLTIRCDVTKPHEIEQMVDAVIARYGQIDVLINNAGSIVVGPLSAMTEEDFEEAMNVMYWGPVRTTLQVLPHMLRRRQGSIVNVASIGGKVAVPHLLPYAAAKFALTGFSEGLTAELASKGIRVTTVIPGLMRTGSHINAFFKGDNRAEYTWFGISASTPGLAIGAEHAARRIVQAIRHGSAELVLGVPAKLAALAHGIAPDVVVRALSLANRLMPDPSAQNKERRRGHESETIPTRSPLTAFGRKAAERWNQEKLA